MKTLEKKYPTWAEILRYHKRKKRNFDVIAEQSYTGEPILKVQDKDKVYYLNGKYAPSMTVERWLEQQEMIDKFATIVIVGISNGVHIKRIMESVPKTVNILVYEPSYEIFRRAMEEVDLSFLFELDIPVGIVVSKINEFEIETYFRYLIAYDNMVSLKIYISGNYYTLFPKQIGEFIKDLKYYLHTIKINWNTIIRYTDINARNIFHNLRYLYEGYSVADLQNILPKDVPAIIVSAGPSLNKNIMDLKAAVGKACIIATDTAMKPLLNAGIIPDLFVIVDGLKPIELFQHKNISKTGMVTMTAVAPPPMDFHKGKKFFYYSGSPFEVELVKKINEMEERNVYLRDIPSGGSVATSAYSLGVQMGARTVILVGQDLALTGNKVHVDGAFENEKCEIEMESGEYFEVEAIDGGTVISRIDFKIYLDWFEVIAREWSHIQMIDATEGGALIKGSKVMTLKKAIQKYCVKEFNAKWHIARVPKIFRTKEEREYALKYFEDCIERLEEIQKKAKDGYFCYERLQKIAKDKPENQEEIQNLFKKIKEVNDFMEKDDVAEMVMDSLKGVEYTLRPSIYKVKEDDADELDEIIKHGYVMLGSIYHAAEELKGIAKEELLPFVEEQRKKEKSGT